jgi:hypothetical protein
MKNDGSISARQTGVIVEEKNTSNNVEPGRMFGVQIWRHFQRHLQSKVLKMIITFSILIKFYKFRHQSIALEILFLKSFGFNLIRPATWPEIPPETKLIRDGARVS